MIRPLLSLGAACLLLALSGPAFAGTHVSHYSSGTVYHSGPHVGSYNYVSYNGVSRNFGPTNSYHLNYGRPFSYGFYYSGPYHNQWTYRCWYPGYGCYCYWCPCSCCWYYWCAPQNCYYPITYINIAAPGATAAPAAAGLTGLPTPPAGLMAPAAP
jgi:hypothetical protein